jgi:hypothetical protein
MTFNSGFIGRSFNIYIWVMKRSMRLLVIEDEEKLARLVKRALVAERFSVDVANDGRAGLELTTTYDYDRVVFLSAKQADSSAEKGISSSPTPPVPSPLATRSRGEWIFIFVSGLLNAWRENMSLVFCWPLPDYSSGSSSRRRKAR